MNIGLTLTITGAILLFLTSVVHIFKGYPRLMNAINTGSIKLPAFSKDTRHIMSYEELQAVWLSFGSHLLAISAILLLLTTGICNGSRALVIILAMVPIIDAVIMKIRIKVLHAGVPLLALSGLLVIIGQLLVG